jgi:4'-phosphopantetheinyl transferase
MMYIYYTTHSNNYQRLFEKYNACLPETVIQKLGSFRFESDASRHLLGNLLLLKALADMGCTAITLGDLRFTEYNKPYFAGNLFFNISHSGAYVLCAVSKTNRVGIDIEAIRDIGFKEFSGCFTAGEWTCINTSDDPGAAFYRFWTRKEAVIKADGRGLQIPLQSFEVIHDVIEVNGCTWYLHPVTISDGYIAHVAADYNLANGYTLQCVCYDPH